MEMLLNGFCLGSIAIIFMIVLRDLRHLLIARVFLLLLFAGVAFLLRDVVSPEWKWLMSDIMTFVPALFWLLCQLGFARKPDLYSIWSVLAAYSCVIPVFGRQLGADVGDQNISNILLWRLPQIAEYIVILHGIWVVVANWENDLLADRRRMRAVLLCTVGVSALWVTLSLNTGYLSEPSLPVVVGITVLIAGNFLLIGREDVLLIQPFLPQDGAASDNGKTEKVATKSACPMAQKLMALMAKGYYRTEKLTLKMLAQELGLPEYKTRSLINKAFDYRNFNDYINHLRIAEASARLVSEPDTPIQNIALDVGYRTISSFNRTFREIHQQTPSDYRAKYGMSDSDKSVTAI
jgi:AraC-like DNA-binding protein